MTRPRSKARPTWQSTKKDQAAPGLTLSRMGAQEGLEPQPSVLECGKVCFI
jgi:hypothetical protein